VNAGCAGVGVGAGVGVAVAAGVGVAASVDAGVSVVTAVGAGVSVVAGVVSIVGVAPGLGDGDAVADPQAPITHATRTPAAASLVESESRRMRPCIGCSPSFCGHGWAWPRKYTGVSHVARLAADSRHVAPVMGKWGSSGLRWQPTPLPIGPSCAAEFGRRPGGSSPSQTPVNR
jgi:hypothetical protein